MSPASGWMRSTRSVLLPKTSVSPTDSASASPSASPTGPVAGVVTSLPSGSYIAVIKSLYKQSYTGEQAVAYAAERAKGGYTPVAIDADQIPGLKKGFYAIGVPNLKNYAEDKQACAGLGLPNGDSCFPRTVGG